MRVKSALKRTTIRNTVIGMSLFFVVGCAGVAQKQADSMDHYRDQVELESQMTKSDREALYKAQLWYGHSAWQKKKQSTQLAKGQLEREFLECLQSAEAIEKGISEKMGGIDPIQIIHARASVEVCMVTKGNTGVDASKLLICETDEYDVLPICLMARTEVLSYR